MTKLMSRKILISALMVLFIISMIPVLAEEGVDLTVTIVSYVKEVPAGTTTIDASEEAGVVLEDFTSTEQATVTISLHEDNPHPEVDLPTDSPMALGIYLDIATTSTDFTTTIKVYYTDEEVEDAGIKEETLCLYYFDGTDWVQYEETGVETEDNYVWAIVDHFTAFALFGASPKPPIADAGGPYFGRRRESLSFDGTQSYDPDGEIVSYSWDFGDGETGTGPTPSHIYQSVGKYAVTLTVTDNDELTDGDDTTVYVSRHLKRPPKNKKPKADAGKNVKISIGGIVYFNGAGSSDKDGEIVSYMWRFGDGETAMGIEVSHHYLVPGRYTVTLTVKDDMGAEDSDKCHVHFRMRGKRVPR